MKRLLSIRVEVIGSLLILSHHPPIPELKFFCKTYIQHVSASDQI